MELRPEIRPVDGGALAVLRRHAAATVSAAGRRLDAGDAALPLGVPGGRQRQRREALGRLGPAVGTALEPAPPDPARRRSGLCRLLGYVVSNRSERRRQRHLLPNFINPCRCAQCSCPCRSSTGRRSCGSAIRPPTASGSSAVSWCEWPDFGSVFFFPGLANRIHQRVFVFFDSVLSQVAYFSLGALTTPLVAVPVPWPAWLALLWSVPLLAINELVKHYEIKWVSPLWQPLFMLGLVRQAGIH